MRLRREIRKKWYFEEFMIMVLFDLFVGDFEFGRIM